MVLSECFKYFPKLVSLDISNNLIGEDGAKSLGVHLKCLASLRKFGIIIIRYTYQFHQGYWMQFNMRGFGKQ